MYIGKKIFLYEIDTMKELSLMFFRLSAFFEVAPFIGRKFGIDEWIESNLDEDGNFIKYEDGTNYFGYWDGFNLPNPVIRNFHKLFRCELTQREQDIVNQARQMPRDGYIIGWAKNGFATTRDHEIAHALYYTEPEYKAQMHALVESLTPELRQQFIDGLNVMGYTTTYHEYVNDEIHAYLVGYDPTEYQESYFPEINIQEVEPYTQQARAIFDTQMSKYN